MIMKNVMLVISLVVNCTALAFVAKYWSPIKGLLDSQHEKTAVMRPIPAPDKMRPAKVMLQEAILAQRTEMESCYDDYLRREPTTSINGSISVHWFINAEGAVESPTIAESKIQDEVLKNCVLENVSKMVFDPKKFADNTQFSYRFNFKARTPGSIKFE